MPVVVLATTEAARVVPDGAGFVSTRVEALVDGARCLLDEPDTARAMGLRARQAAQQRFGLQRFLHEWDQLLSEVT